MIELTGITQTVLAGANVLYDTKVAKCGCGEHHRPGSGIITLAKPGRYLVTFSGNIAIPTGGTVGEVSAAIAINGEPVYGATMTATPAAVNEYQNISALTYIDVCGCCQQVAVENINAQSVLFANANIVVTRVA